MNSMMKPILKPSRTSSTDDETRAVDSATASGRAAATLETPVRRGFESTITGPSGSSWKPYAKEFEAFMRRLDGLRIPSSPLHDL